MIALAGLLASVVACDSAAGGGAATVSDSAGIAIVRNTRPARDTVRLTTPEVRIGDDESKTESIFREVHDVAFTAGGSIAVVDRGTRVVLFDAAGNAPRLLGRQGQGPGEYSAVRFVIPLGDTIAVWDVGQRRMHFYSEAGEPVGSLPMTDNREGRTILPVAGGWLDEGESGQHQDTAPARGFILRRGADGAIRDTVVRPYPVPEIGWQILDAKTGNGAMINPPALGISPAWTSNRDRLVWASAAEPRLHLRTSTGALQRIVELPYPAVAPTEQHRDAYVTTLADRYGMKPDAAARMRTTTRFTDTLPAITRVLLDDRGQIWVAGFTPTEPFSFVGSAWDVLDDDGRLQRRVEFPSGFMLHQVKGRRALGIRTLESGVSTVEVYVLP